MTETIQLLLALFVGIVLGAATIWWLSTRKTTTRAEAIRLAAFAYKEALKLPSAADAIMLAQEQADAEKAEAARFAALVAKSNAPAVA